MVVYAAKFDGHDRVIVVCGDSAAVIGSDGTRAFDFGCGRFHSHNTETATAKVGGVKYTELRQLL